MSTSYPTSVWDGDSQSRVSSNAPFRKPDALDYGRAIQEVAAVQKRLGIGALGGVVGATSGLSIMRQDLGAFQKIIFTLDGVSVVITDATNVEWGGVKLFTFPVGIIRPMLSVVDLALTVVGENLSATADGDYALGTTIVDDLAMAGTKVDLHPKTDIAQLVLGEGPVVGIADEQASIDDATDCYLNITFDAGTATGDDAVLLTGTVSMIFVNFGVLING